jgi:adenosylcobinamide-phosphate synthase
MIDLICAVLLDVLLGDPAWMPHPIRWMGWLLTAEERVVRKYAGSRRIRLVAGGGLCALINIALAFGIPYIVLQWLRAWPLVFHTVQVYLLYTCLAARCLRDEALKVYQALQQGLEEARHKLSFIVGRDTTQLSEPEIVRATVETVAENTADGVIAPLLYAMIGGAPLALAYKMINTMDSMWGYKNERYHALGFFPANIDDIANYFPARITGVCMILGSVFRFSVREGFRIMFRDRRNHKSPNCAYPEGAVAGLLGVQLGGTNIYFGNVVAKPTIGDATRPLAGQDIMRAIEIMFRTEIVLLVLYMGFRMWLAN